MMHTLQSALIAAFEDAIRVVYGEDYVSFNEIVLASSSQFGHYQSNSAMKIGKQMRQNPRGIATELMRRVELTSPPFTMEIAGAGFINIRFRPEYLSLQVKNMLTQSHFGLNTDHKDEKVIVEFSSPNIAKELHVGHLRSTIIGESLARLFEYLGYQVVRLNHLGDFGTQFGMLIHYLKTYEPLVVQGVKKADLTELMEWYKKSKALFDADLEFKKSAQQEVVALQAGDPLAYKVWQKIVEISKAAYHEIYRTLNVTLVDRGESFYQPYLESIVALCEKKGLVEISGGAKCIFMPQFIGRDGERFPLMIQKSDGGFNYDTTDMAALWHRVYHEKADRIIYVTDSGQALHFEMIFAACQQAGFFKERQVRLDHVSFGLVLGSDGKKFKTRSGTTEKLIDLLSEAVSEAAKIMAQKMPDLSEDEMLKMAKILGIDAVKYSDLSTHRIKDYTFSYERMLKFEGNTAPFLLYSYVRSQSILRKIGVKPEALLTYACTLEHPSEIDLGFHLRRFDETLLHFAEDLYPHRLCEYLFDLAGYFNAFFRDCQVVGDKHQESRLILCDLSAKILKKGLELLGLETLEQM